MAASASLSCVYRMYAVPRLVFTGRAERGQPIIDLSQPSVFGGCAPLRQSRLPGGGATIRAALTLSVNGEIQVLDVTKLAKYLLQVILVDIFCQALHHNLGKKVRLGLLVGVVEMRREG